MNKITLMLLCLLTGGAIQAQTADDVIEKYVTALGGIDKLHSIQTLYMEGVAVSPNGMEITSKIYKVQGKLYRQEVDFGMGSMTTIITDKEGWFSNPRNGGVFEAMPPEMRTAQLSELDCGLPLVEYAAKGHKAELTGTEEVNGQTCYVIKLTLNTGRVTNYYISNKDWLLVQSTTIGGRIMMGGGFRGGNENRQPPGGGPGAPQGEMQIKTEYSDYKKTADGFLFPMTITRPGMGGRGMNTSIEKLEVNKPVDEKLFKPE